jgi:hypothetical protein
MEVLGSKLVDSLNVFENFCLKGLNVFENFDKVKNNLIYAKATQVLYY